MLTLILISLATVSCVHGGKYGHDFPSCPYGYPIPAVCGEYCGSDADCRSGYFCCRANCYVGCLPRPKEGICPIPNKSACGIYQCENDYDCPGRQKCCRVEGCKSTCNDPVKPGQCPKRYGPGPCVVLCTSDYDCKGDEKCCGSCPRKCEKPCDHK